MGVKELNPYLMRNCPKDTIKKTSFKTMKGKRVVVDISIYLYKFVGEEALVENLFLLISIFKCNHITPIFIFDGKPPAEKKQLLIQRHKHRMEAATQYQLLKTQLESNSCHEDSAIQDKMQYLKMQSTRIKYSDIITAKQLLDSCGIEHYDANGEADKLCAHMVLTNQVWACVSDDMDMLVYGCQRVIRQISLMNHTCYLYDMESILQVLDMDIKTFRQIMVLSGTDYNINNHTPLQNTLQWYHEYKTSDAVTNSNFTSDTPFYDWLVLNTNYIKNIDVLHIAYAMFTHIDENDLYDKKTNSSTSITTCSKHNYEQLAEILLTDGFLRPPLSLLL